MTDPELEARRIAVLGDMRELGPESPALHAGLAEPLRAAKVDRVFAAGPLMDALWRALPEGMRGAYAETSAGIESGLAESLKPGDVITIRGGEQIQNLYKGVLANHPPQPIDWVNLDQENLTTTVQGFPGTSDISLPVDVNVVVEFLAR